MRIEICDVDALRRFRAAGNDLRKAALIELDLTDGDADALLSVPADGALLLGCRLTEKRARRLAASGALIFPAIPDLPYHPYRSTLYTPQELFAKFDPKHPKSYAQTPDFRIYEYSKTTGKQSDPLHALAQRLHDHSISEALDELLEKASNPVAIMGGHALARDSAGYRTAVDLGVALGRAATEFTVLTGGGPGAMEAVPLGVRLANATDFDNSTIDEALSILSKSPTFDTPKKIRNPSKETPQSANQTVNETAIGEWIAAGLEIEFPRTENPRTIGIPTWFYGHEPPNPACESHAKYFANSVREDGLLTVATAGVVYTPGSAGTVQEVFQDYTQNHYASLGEPAPMIFLGTRFWTEEVPVMPLLRRLADGRQAASWILVTDDITEAVRLLEKYAKR